MIHPDYADSIIREAMTQATAGLDIVTAMEGLECCIKAIRKQARALEGAEYDGKPPDQVARTMAHTAKTIDEIFRLLAFAKGQPDSRPDVGGAWLQALSDEQLTQVERMIQENARAEDGPSA